MNILNSFDLNVNFWVVNPSLKIPEAFAKLYNSDKSKEKKDSSQIMWAIALLLDSDSKFFNLPEEDRKNLIKKDYLKNEKFSFMVYKDAVDMYSQLILTPAKRALAGWNDKITERDQFLRETPYTLGDIGDKGNWVGGTADVIDRMMSNTKKLYDDYQRIIEDLEEEKTKESGKGNRKASLADSGEI
jgi:hypothetical protein